MSGAKTYYKMQGNIIKSANQGILHYQQQSELAVETLKAQHEAKDIQDDFKLKVEETTEEVKDLRKEMEEAAKAYNDVLESIFDNFGLERTLDKLKDISNYVSTTPINKAINQATNMYRNNDNRIANIEINVNSNADVEDIEKAVSKALNESWGGALG